MAFWERVLAKDRSAVSSPQFGHWAVAYRSELARYNNANALSRRAWNEAEDRRIESMLRDNGIRSIRRRRPL